MSEVEFHLADTFGELGLIQSKMHMHMQQTSQRRAAFKSALDTGHACAAGSR